MSNLAWLLIIGAVLTALAVLVPDGTEKGKRLVGVLLILAIAVFSIPIAATWGPLLFR